MCIACFPSLRGVFNAALNGREPGGFSATAPLGARSATSRRASWTAQGASADTIFHNGRVLTANDVAPRAEALAVRDGRIVAIGSADQVMQAKDADTKMIDLGGYALAPGLIDPHMHPGMTLFESWIDVGPMANVDLDAALARVKSAASRTPPGEWIKGQGIDPSIMAGAMPGLEGLDAIAPDNPLFLIESNGHIAYVNSRAIALAGLAPGEPDPPQGRYVRDAAGGFTGRLEEGPAYARFMAKIGRPSSDELSEAMGRLFKRAASVGCTALNDMGMGAFAGAADFQATRAAMDQDPPIRLTAFLSTALFDRWKGLGLTPGWGDDRFRIMGMKAWADGSNQGLTGYQRAPYLNSESRGSMNYPVEELTETIRLAYADGWRVAVHANGDAAIDATLDAYAAAMGPAPRAGHGCRIEHCSILHPEQIQRMAALGLSPSFLIGHVHFWGRAFRDRILGPERADLYDPCRSALEAGLRISLHSDFAVTPLEPLRCMENAVTRIMRDGGGVLNPSERITAHQALKSMTIDAAWQCGIDELTGSLEIGKAADLVVLESDPAEVDPTTIKSIKVVETWLDGERRFQG